MKRRIVVGTVDGYSGEESVHAFQWLAAHDGGVLDDVMRRRLWQNPEIVVEAARSLRRLAREGLDPKTRQEAADALKRYGLDDESLKNFPED